MRLFLPLIHLSRFGRLALPVSLVLGISLPTLAASLKPWLPELVLALLFFSSLRVAGPMIRHDILPDRQTTLTILTLQLILPLIALGLFMALELIQSPVALAIVLMLSAPSVTGAPSFTILLGHAPSPAFRLLLVGTILLPLTMTPIFWAAPALGDFSTSLAAALKLLVSILLTVGCAFGLRRLGPPRLSQDTTKALDGMLVLLLVVMVIGLMSALGPALRQSPLTVLGWLVLTLVVNLGLQMLTFTLLKTGPLAPRAVPYAVVSGNRNFALFLIALPESTIDQLLIFLGCYQIPMYLTPLIMHRFYNRL
jgi:hypothetical protein